MKYKIKVGDRFLLWVDECWYETEKDGGVFFDSIDDVTSAILQMKKHYRFDVKVFEISPNGLDKEISISFAKPKTAVIKVNKDDAFMLNCIITL